MVLKYLAIENLIERNKAAEEEAEEKGDDQEEEETASEENSCTTTIKELGVKTPSNLKKSSAIHFPFLVVKGSSTPSVVMTIFFTITNFSLDEFIYEQFEKNCKYSIKKSIKYIWRHRCVIQIEIALCFKRAF